MSGKIRLPIYMMYTDKFVVLGKANPERNKVIKDGELGFSMHKELCNIRTASIKCAR
jgi:hypothetical protein